MRRIGHEVRDESLLDVVVGGPPLASARYRTPLVLGASAAGSPVDDDPDHAEHQGGLEDDHVFMVGGRSRPATMRRAGWRPVF